ncbi:hypothetical protein H4S07_001607 [Coemansia furcata]|uniref:Uncharacterized protein n=1 Tax=Coemansia furcata TaxID=417177 RepID=A0ACC1LNS9_9FUNG|nr:hypothetical protein H4S07_001607 [Coemansia furcata]
MSEEPRISQSPVDQIVDQQPANEEEEEQPPSPPADDDDEAEHHDEEEQNEYASMGAPNSVDMTDAMTKARAIAAKLGSMQRPPPPAAQPLGDDAYESRAGEEDRGEQDRYRRRRSASPERDGGYKRGRGESRGRRYDVEPAFGDAAPVEFMVPAALVGLIIGRSGSNLKGIEQQHGVRIQMNADFDKRDPERKISIDGPPPAADAAKRDIMDFIDRHQQTPRAPPAAGGGYAEPQNGGGMTTILVPSSKVGLIIGRGGENIRDIQFSSGARVQVQPDSGRGGLERPIQLIGAPEQIEVARARIMEIVSSERGPGGPPGPRGGQDYASGSYAGGGSYGAPPRGAGSYGGPPADRGMPQQGAHSEEMQIPAEAVGIVIGRGGETIKQLQQASGARIQIIQGSDRNAPFKPVTISGDHAACMRARRMIEEKVDSAQYGGQSSSGYEQRGGGGGGYGGQHASGYGGGYDNEPVEQKAWGQQQQPSYYGGAQPSAQYGAQPTAQYGNAQPSAQYGAAYQQGYQAQAAEQPQQWTNQMTADHYAQYAATNPEYAQYAEYYRKLAEKDPNGIVPSG